MKKRIFFCLFSIIFFISCDNDIVNEASGNQAYDKKAKIFDITISDFEVTPTEVDSLSIEALINAESSFLDNKASESSSNDSCLNEKTFNSATFEESDNDFYELIGTDIDVLSCYPSTSSENSILGSITEQSFKFSFINKIKFLDSNNNPVNLQGLTLSEISQFNNYKKYSFLKLYLVSESKGLVLGQNFSLKQEEIVMKSNASNWQEPCFFDPEIGIIDDCADREVSRATSVTSNGSLEEINLTILTANNLKTSDSGTYFTGGNFSFVLNNWSGIMTYDQSDSEVAPSYTVTNGFQEINGIFNFLYLNKNDRFISKVLKSEDNLFFLF